MVKNHFAKLLLTKQIHDSGVGQGYAEFMISLNKIRDILREINPADDPLIFSFISSTLLAEIERLNLEIFSKYKVKCGLFIIENIKLKDQKKNYRYNKVYLMNSRGLDRLSDLQKTM